MSVFNRAIPPLVLDMHHLCTITRCEFHHNTDTARSSDGVTLDWPPLTPASNRLCRPFHRPSKMCIEPKKSARPPCTYTPMHFTNSNLSIPNFDA
jgi:hypothetical protein